MILYEFDLKLKVNFELLFVKDVHYVFSFLFVEFITSLTFVKLKRIKN